MRIHDYARMLTYAGPDDLGSDEIGEAKPIKLADEPEMVADRDEGFRIHRLHQTWGLAQATVSLLSVKYQLKWDGAILALEDSKGALTVTWKDETSRVLFEGVILGAWEKIGEQLHRHRLADPKT